MTADVIREATMSGAEFVARYAQQQAGEEVSSCAVMPNSCHAGYPAVRVVQGELYELVETAHELLAERSPRLFQYGGVLVHAERLPQSLEVKGGVTVPANTIILEPASKEWLQLALARIAPWLKPVVKRDGSLDWVRCDPPAKVAAGVLADRAGWQCRVLNGVTEIPILREDGSICATPGYDEHSGLYFDPNGRSFPAISTTASRDDAVAAIIRLQDPLRDFPFVDPCHLSAALAMILTAIIRRQLPTAPAFGVSAREAGTGKGLLVDTVAMIATGRKSPITPFTDDEAEQRKRITSSLLAGHPIINIDNIDAPVDSAALCALLTSTTWEDRILGVNEHARVPTNALVIMTGNNLVVQGDMTRRVIPIELDAQCERPELRSFDRALLPWLDRHRGQLVADALTVLSAWRLAGRPVEAGSVPLGSFEEWSREIVGCLVWLGLPDPTDAMTRQRAADPKRAQLRRVLVNWYELFGDAEQTVNAVMQSVEQVSDERPASAELREVITEVTADARNDRAMRTKLGMFIRSNAGRVVTVEDGTGLRFVEAGTIKHAARWKVELV